jgi:hypothetical protein
MGRSDLIGNGRNQLVPTYQPIGTGRAHEGQRKPGKGGAPPARSPAKPAAQSRTQLTGKATAHPFRTQHTGLPRTPTTAPRRPTGPKRKPGR